LNADLRNKREEEGEFAVGDRSAAEHYHDEVDDAEAAEEDLGVRKAPQNAVNVTNFSKLRR
jgi:hypothetical protein